MDLRTTPLRRILIRGTNWIGDAVMTTPAVRTLRRSYPGARIDMLLKPWVLPVFAHSPDLDGVVVYESGGRHRGLPGLVRLARDLRRRRYDAAFLLQNAFEAALIAFLAGIPRRVGYNTDARGPLLTRSVPRTARVRRLHQTRYYLEMLRGAGLTPEPAELHLTLGAEDRGAADALLAREGVGPGEALWGLNPSAVYGPAKQWAPERFARLGDFLVERYGGRVLVFGGPGDEALGRRIARRMDRPPVDLAGRTSLGEAMALIDRCRALVTNDSGLMHVAAALGTPVVAVFGSTDPVATGPASPLARVVRTDIACSPCLEPRCPEGHLACMDRIEVATVLRALEDAVRPGRTS